MFRMSEEKSPLDALAEATRRYRRTETAHEEARRVVTAAVLDALRAGERPTDVAERSPFTDAYIRRFARENGIEPRRKGGGKS